jgi:hypothetical protein
VLTTFFHPDLHHCALSGIRLSFSRGRQVFVLACGNIALFWSVIDAKPVLLAIALGRFFADCFACERFAGKKFSTC